MDQESENIDDLAERFLAKPEDFVLYRGERDKVNQGGVHFTTNKEWTKNFGHILLEGRLPAGSMIKLITEDDMERALQAGILTSQGFFESLFARGYDAVVGHDQMNSRILDVVVNPKHLPLFKVSE